MIPLWVGEEENEFFKYEVKKKNTHTNAAQAESVVFWCIA